MLRITRGNGQTIQPNQCLMVEKEEMTVKDVDVYDYISWIDGVLQFHEKSLQKVLNSLSRYYRVRFDCPMEIGQDKSARVIWSCLMTLTKSCRHFNGLSLFLLAIRMK